jgi:hypothetical protein
MQCPPLEDLRGPDEAVAHAQDVGLRYVYEGNIYSDGAHTKCPACKTLLIQRSWHDVQQSILKNGACPKCATKIPGRWANDRAQSPDAATGAKARSVAAAKKYSHLNL